MDYLASQMRACFEILGYPFESYNQHTESYFSGLSMCLFVAGTTAFWCVASAEKPILAMSK